MQLSPDSQVFWQYGFRQGQYHHRLHLAADGYPGCRRKNRYRRTVDGNEAFPLAECPRGQSFSTTEKQIAEVGLVQPRRFLGFIGTLFLFVALASLCTVFPGYRPPTGSLSTTVALALCVFIAVPLYGIKDNGLIGYFRTYMEPTFIMLPFNIIGEISRTLALAVRLFGNMMSGEMIIGILLTITPYVFPIVMTLLGLLTGMVQAYIFSVLATVYIAAAMSDQASPTGNRKQNNEYQIHHDKEDIWIA